MQVYSESRKIYNDTINSIVIVDAARGISAQHLAGCITCLVPEFSYSRMEAPAVNYNNNLPHYHDGFQLFFILPESCSNSQIVEHQEISISPGGFLLLPPHMVHQMVRDHSQGYFLTFSLQFLLKDVSRETLELFFDWGYLMPYIRSNIQEAIVLSPSSQTLSLSFHDRLNKQAEIFNKIKTVFLKPSSPYNKIYGGELCRAFDSFAHELRKEFYSTCSEKELQLLEKYRTPLLTVIEYIYAHLCERISITQLCEISGFGRAWLSKLFEKVMFIPIVEYINFTRMQKARMLLINTERNVADIAHECGYSSTIYFDRVFKHHTGCTPQVYRREYLLEWED